MTFSYLLRKFQNILRTPGHRSGDAIFTDPVGPNPSRREKKPGFRNEEG
jgi:hypothetical protein